MLPNLLTDPTSPARALAGVMAFYVSGEEALESRVFNTAAGVTLTIGVRFMLVSGEVVRYNFLHTPNTAGTLDRARFPLPEGWILNAAVVASAGTPTGVQCLCVLRLVAGLTANAVPLGVLCQGAITASQELSWPLTIAGSGSSASSPIGLARTILGTNPAAGAEITETVTAGKTWKLIAFRARFVTSATVATRVPDLVIDDGVNILIQADTQLTQPASSTGTWQWGAVGQRDSAALTYNWAMLPPHLLLPAGTRIRTLTGNLQVGDDYDAPTYIVEEF